MTKPNRRRVLGSIGAVATAAAGIETVARERNAANSGVATDALGVDVGCFRVTLESPGDVDRLDIHTDDGSSLGFVDPEGRRFGYYDHVAHSFDDWYGLVERVDVAHDGETITVVNGDDCPTFDVGCDRLESDHDAYDLRLEFDNASKRYDPPAGTERVFGSPGRRLTGIVEMLDERSIRLTDTCTPDTERGVVFENDSVTVHTREFLNGANVLYNVVLTFDDGETERASESDVAITPPVTFCGSGRNRTKSISRLTFWNDPTGGAIFTYENPSIDSERTPSQE